MVHRHPKPHYRSFHHYCYCYVIVFDQLADNEIYVYHYCVFSCRCSDEQKKHIIQTKHPYTYHTRTQEGEPVEYTTVTQGNGKVRAENVTGPMGAYVQGAPRNMYGGGGGFGGGGGGGFGGGGFGGGGGQGGYGGGGGGFGRREG